MYKIQKYRRQRLSRKKYTGLSLSRKSCRRRRHTKTKRCHIRSYTRRFRKYTIKRGNKRVRKNIQYNVAEAPAGGGGGDDGKVEAQDKFNEGDKVQIKGNTNPDLIFRVERVYGNICVGRNKRLGPTYLEIDSLESVPPTVLAAQEKQQKLDEKHLQEQRAHWEEGEQARQDHLAKLNQ
jgi:hypothetical protein